MNENIFQKKVLTDDVLLISTGRILDNNNAHDMVNEISSANESGFKYVILDMMELEFLSSAGVGSILGTVEIFREIDGDIIICNASPTILHVLTVLDLADYLTITLNEEAAIVTCGIEE